MDGVRKICIVTGWFDYF